MKSSDLLTICTVALGTAAATVATLSTGSLEAGKGSAPAENARPKLVAHGVELTLTAANDQVFKAGDAPVFELAALNTNTVPANLCVRLAMTATSPADALSRVLRLPAMICQEERQLALQPGERKTLTIAPQAKLPANKLISVSLLEVDPAKAPATAPAVSGNTKLAPAVFSQAGITMLSFSTVAPTPKGQALVSLPEPPQVAKAR